MKYKLNGTHVRKENGYTVYPDQVVSLDHLTEEEIDFLVIRGIYREVKVVRTNKGDK